MAPQINNVAEAIDLITSGKVSVSNTKALIEACPSLRKEGKMNLRKMFHMLFHILPQDYVLRKQGEIITTVYKHYNKGLRKNDPAAVFDFIAQVVGQEKRTGDLPVIVFK